MQTAESYPDVDGNVSRSSFIEFIEEYTDVDQAVAQAVGMRKDLRKRIRGAGFSLAAFDRARAEAEKSADKREAEDREFRRNLAWLGKPMGHQGNLFTGEAAEGEEGEHGAANGNGEDTEEGASQQQSYQVELAGRAAGENGRDRNTNPWGVGSELNRTWDRGWVNGQAILAGAKPQPEQAAAPRRPGRPRRTPAAAPDDAA